MRSGVVLIVVSGSLLLGQASVQPHNSAPNPYTTIGAAEGVAVDGAGNLYGAVVPARMIQKHLKK